MIKILKTCIIESILAYVFIETIPGVFLMNELGRVSKEKGF